MVEEEDIVQAFDIDPTPAPTFIGDATYVISPDVTDVRYGGWTDNTYLFVVPRGGAAGKFDINFSPLEELNGVIYDVHSTVTLSNEGFPEYNPAVTTEDVRVFIWNCRGIARASFRPHLFTIREVTGADVVVLTETRAAGKNARSLLNTATTMEYFYTEPHGFVGGVSVIWDTSRVAVTGIIGDDYYVSFQVKVRVYHTMCIYARTCCHISMSLFLTCIFSPPNREPFELMAECNVCHALSCSEQLCTVRCRPHFMRGTSQEDVMLLFTCVCRDGVQCRCCAHCTHVLYFMQQCSFWAHGWTYM